MQPLAWSGAAHAGWRGAAAGVLEATVGAMEALGATRGGIAAVIGPCIAQASYEVGEDLHAEVAPGYPGSAAFFAPGRPGHWQFDLAGYCVARLRQAGVQRRQSGGTPARTRSTSSATAAARSPTPARSATRSPE